MRLKQYNKIQVLRHIKITWINNFVVSPLWNVEKSYMFAVFFTDIIFIYTRSVGIDNYNSMHACACTTTTVDVGGRRCGTNDYNIILIIDNKHWRLCIDDVWFNSIIVITIFWNYLNYYYYYYCSLLLYTITTMYCVEMIMNNDIFTHGRQWRQTQRTVETVIEIML